CRVQITGPRGTEIKLRHAESLFNGMLNTENLRSALQTDRYTLSGDSTESYEPRFVCHGFRYVEVTGLLRPSDLLSLEAKVVRDALEPAGGFVCSNELLNQIYRAVCRSFEGNYRSIPIDCPQRDERQGWLGDRGAVCRGETYVFNTAAFYTKWLKDIADAQKESGSLPDICPAYWPLYSDDVAWPSTAIALPEMLHEQYGDTDIVRAQYPTMKKWTEYMERFVT